MKISKRGRQTKVSSTVRNTAKAKELVSQGYDVIEFTAGEPDFYTPIDIKNAGIEAIKSDFTRYTQNSGTNELKEAICSKLKRDNNLDYVKEEIVVSTGAKHSLINTILAIVDDGDEVIVPKPFWVSYESMIQLAGGVPVFATTYEKDDYKPQVEELEKYITDKTVAIILNSPSNPTGAVYSYEELKSYADFAKKYNLIVISDEIYEKLIYDDNEHISIGSFPGMKERTVVINGFSKSHSMTGWRVGYLAAPLDLAIAVNNIQSHMTSNTNSISQMAALKALECDKDTQIMSKSFWKRRDLIYDKITSIKLLKAVKPKGAFYLFVDVSQLFGNVVNNITLTKASDVAEVLLKNYYVGVIPCDGFGMPTHLRLSYAISEDNIIEGIKRIEKFINDNF